VQWVPLPIGTLFPLGGPVPPDLVIGRRGEIEELERRLREGLSTMLVGSRRVGKTTVCEAACAALADEFFVVNLEVPVRSDSRALLQMVVDRCSRISLWDEGRVAARVIRPMLEKWLGDQGVPLDLGAFPTAHGELPTRTILGLPLEIARQRGRRGVLFLDEVQRAVDYADGAKLLSDVVDLYGGDQDVVVLADGSDERTLDDMLGPTIGFGKLVDRQHLAPEIPIASWREPLTLRFADAHLELGDAPLGRLLAWSRGRPYATMAAARYTALCARKTDSRVIGDFELQMGCDEARRHLGDDNA
jgi:hypothetical protein